MQLKNCLNCNRLLIKEISVKNRFCSLKCLEKHNKAIRDNNAFNKLAEKDASSKRYARESERLRRRKLF